MILTPRIYKPNMQWQIVAQNKMDTITMLPILNTTGDDPEEFYTETFTSAVVGGNTLSLPIANTLAPTHRRVMYNIGPASWFTEREFAKSRFEVVMATGSKQFTLEEPVNGIPNVTLSLVGNSSIYARGGGTYDNLPSLSQLQNNNYSLAQWITTNRTELQTGNLSWIYESGIFSTNLWARNIVSGVVGGNIILPTANDIYTTWWRPNEGVQIRTKASYNYWNNSFHGWSTSNQPAMMFPVNASGSDFAELFATAISIIDYKSSYTVSIEKINKYTYNVSWVAPVRVAYLAASREFNLALAAFDVDNWAFVDNITHVNITLIGKPYSTDEVAISYSLDDSNNITENVKNVYVNKIDKSEVITVNSTYGGQDWKTQMAKEQLLKYAKGKYVVKCDVPAEWAIQNSISINSVLQVAQQDSTLIMRNDTPCNFTVKTITKKFQSNEFLFTLGLMEV